MPNGPTNVKERIERIKHELEQLRHEQDEWLRTAVYVGMNRAEMARESERLAKIKQLVEELGKLKKPVSERGSPSKRRQV